MKVTIVFMLLILLSSSSCEKMVDHVYSIKIVNNSPDTILFYDSYDYPDTLIVSEKPSLTLVYPSKYSFLDSKKEWDEVLVPSQDTISIYVLSKDTVENVSWDDIKGEYNILKRYDLSYEDLEEI